MKAFITGISGQVGSHLAEFLLAKDYEVFGIVRRISTWNRGRIAHLFGEKFNENNLFYGDVTDPVSLINALKAVGPVDELYHLAAQGHTKVSFTMPDYTLKINAGGTLNILEALRVLGYQPKIYFASSVEIFAPSNEPLTEESKFGPRNPYGASKLYAHEICRIYRESYNMFISRGITSNHESIRRSKNFLPRKVTSGIIDILEGRREKIYLGNLDSRRDWGYVPDFVEAMWSMLQQDKPDDFVIATNESHTVREFAEEAFKLANLDWGKYVGFDPQYALPLDPFCYQGDYSKAERILGWKPKVRFKELVKILLDEELKIKSQEF